MLDKLSEKVIIRAIQQYNEKDENFIIFENTDADAIGIPPEHLINICEDLQKNGYINNFAKYVVEGCRFQLTNPGITYFKIKRKEQLLNWLPIVVSIISLLRPEIEKIISVWLN